jgi:YVTN family beta-propeller protein
LALINSNSCKVAICLSKKILCISFIIIIIYLFHIPSSYAFNESACIDIKILSIDCIRVERLPTSISFNSNKNLLYVTNTNSNTISVIDANTNRVTDTVLVDKNPQNVKYIPDTNSIYVANYLSNTISVIDANTNRVNKSIMLPTTDKGPVDILFNFYNKGLYVLNKESRLSLINTASNQLVSDYFINKHPIAMTFDIKKNILYVLAKDNIYGIYGTDLSIRPILSNTNKLFSGPVDIDINPFSQKLYVTDSNNKSTVIINLTNDNLGNRKIPMRYAPENIYINSATNTIYESLPEGGFIAAITEISPSPPLLVTIAYLLSASFFVFLILLSLYIFKKRDKILLKSNEKKISKININIQNYLSNKSMALLSLIIMPSILVVLNLIHSQILLPIIVGNDLYLPNTPPEVLFFNLFLSAIYLFVIILIIVIYPPYPFSKSLYKYYEKISFMECVKEYELTKKILWISIPILILVTVYPYINIILEKHFAIHILKIEQNPVYTLVEVMSLFIVLSGVSKITITTLFRKDFFLCLAKGYFESIENYRVETLSNQTEDTKNLVKGLEGYNEYMIKIFNRKINDIDKIIKTILASNDYNKKVKEISLEFKEATNINALEPLRTMLKYSIGKSKSEQQEPELFLVNKTIREKVAGTTVFLTTMLIPLVIAIINLFQLFK